MMPRLRSCFAVCDQGACRTAHQKLTAQQDAEAVADAESRLRMAGEAAPSSDGRVTNLCRRLLLDLIPEQVKPGMLHDGVLSV